VTEKIKGFLGQEAEFFIFLFSRLFLFLLFSWGVG
jgi:hypothetical protein